MHTLRSYLAICYLCYIKETYNACTVVFKAAAWVFSNCKILASFEIFLFLCMQPLLDLLRDHYGERFSASAFSVKFSGNGDEECPRPHIKLVLPETEIKNQGYVVTTDITPCLVRTSVREWGIPIS